jgi:hypothetical protein
MLKWLRSGGVTYSETVGMPVAKELERSKMNVNLRVIELKN